MYLTKIAIYAKYVKICKNDILSNKPKDEIHEVHLVHKKARTEDIFHHILNPINPE